jgi:hypothetical protein
MGRLIKSEYIDTVEYGKYNYDCFKNPSLKEFQDAANNPVNYGNVIRGILLRDGTLYIWDTELIHSRAIREIGIPNGIHLIITNDNYLLITLNQEINPFYLREAFTNTTSLYNYINKNDRVQINTGIYKADKFEVYNKIKTVNDILNIEDAQNLKE